MVIVSFGVPEGARRWLEDTKSPFPFWLDQGRTLYRACGLHRSLKKVWPLPF